MSCQAKKQEEQSSTTAKVTLENIQHDVYKLLGVNENPQGTFSKWTIPIRYYVEGLEDYPESEKNFIAIANEMAEITGLDIQRHEKIYWPSRDKPGNPDSPDGHFTNMHFFYYPDFESLSNQSEYLQVAEILGSSRERERAKYKRASQGNGNKDIWIFRMSESKSSLFYSNFFGQNINFATSTSNEFYFEWLTNLLNIDNLNFQNTEKVYLTKFEASQYTDGYLSQFELFLIKSIYENFKILLHGNNLQQAADTIVNTIYEKYQAKGLTQ